MILDRRPATAVTPDPRSSKELAARSADGYMSGAVLARPESAFGARALMLCLADAHFRDRCPTASEGCPWPILMIAPAGSRVRQADGQGSSHEELAVLATISRGRLAGRQAPIWPAASGAPWRVGAHVRHPREKGTCPRPGGMNPDPGRVPGLSLRGPGSASMVAVRTGLGWAGGYRGFGRPAPPLPGAARRAAFGRHPGHGPGGTAVGGTGRR